jgi:glycosyltransferase involved in cell wall biosynthesis
LADELWFTGEELAPWFEPAGARARRYSQTVPRDFSPPTAAERSAAREELDVDQDVTLINYVGRLDGEKGLSDIVDALARADEHGDWRMLVGGDGTMGPWLQAAIAERGLGDRVRLLGRLDRAAVRVLQGASDFHLYAGTVGCGVSVALLEAMASGVIPIVSDVPRLQRDLVADSGWVFPAGDADALTRALGEAISCGEAERGRRRARVLEQAAQRSTPTISELVQSLPRHRAQRL